MAKKSLAVGALLCSLLLALAVAAPAQDLSKRLTNQDVIDMVGLGLSDDVIIEKIRTADEVKFDTSVEALKALKAAKVSDAVIKQMINPKAPPAPVATVAAAAPAAPADDPNLPPKEIGMYWKDGGSWVPVRLPAWAGVRASARGSAERSSIVSFSSRPRS